MNRKERDEAVNAARAVASRCLEIGESLEKLTEEVDSVETAFGSLAATIEKELPDCTHVTVYGITLNTGKRTFLIPKGTRCHLVEVEGDPHAAIDGHMVVDRDFKEIEPDGENDQSPVP